VKETTLFGFPYPEDTDVPNGPAQIKALAEKIEEALAAVMPPGIIAPLAKAAAPTGWLLCDGSAVSRSGATKRLFEAIGTTFGTGNGSTTFNLPDLRGRVPVGVDGTAGRLSEHDAIGESSGEEKHTLSIGEIPSHKHAFSLETNAGANNTAAKGSALPLGETETAAAGGGGAHNNMQPFQITQYAIKT
jgi:microcystin-dependent protein